MKTLKNHNFFEKLLRFSASLIIESNSFMTNKKKQQQQLRKCKCVYSLVNFDFVSLANTIFYLFIISCISNKLLTILNKPPFLFLLQE